jgi:hypothetical protein
LIVFKGWLQPKPKQTLRLPSGVLSKNVIQTAQDEAIH